MITPGDCIGQTVPSTDRIMCGACYSRVRIQQGKRGSCLLCLLAPVIFWNVHNSTYTVSLWPRSYTICIARECGRKEYKRQGLQIIFLFRLSLPPGNNRWLSLCWLLSEVLRPVEGGRREGVSPQKGIKLEYLSHWSTPYPPAMFGCPQEP